MLIKIFIGLLILIGLFLPIRFAMLAKKSAQMSPQLGVSDAGGHLTVCSSKPNCVSSAGPESDTAHYIAPTSISSNPIAQIKKDAAGQPGFKLVEESENYLRLEFKSALFGFVDDIEFMYSAGDQKLHLRSASRVGHSDMA